MIRFLRLALPATLALAAIATAQPAKAPPPARATGRPTVAVRQGDQLDFLFLASDRPVRLRLHLRFGDRPYTAAWDEWMDRLFAWFDKDKNGFLDAAEVARLMPANYLQIQVQGSIGGPSGQTVPFATLDSNKDGKVSKEEFRAYHRNNGFAALRFFNNNFQARNAKQVNDSIYRQLGLKPDGRLRKEDAARLPGLMARLDEDENELLTAAELNTDGDNDTVNYEFAVPVGGRMPAVQQTEPGLMEIQPTMTPLALARQVLARYDRNKDGKLTPSEVKDRGFFAELDADRDGKLDLEELKAYFRRPPDLVLRARVGPLGGGLMNTLNSWGLPVRRTPRAEVLDPARPLAKKVRKVSSDNLSFDLGDARFTFQASEGGISRNARFNGAKNFYLQQFDSIVDKKKGYIEKKQEKENQQMPFVFQIFNQADRNGDGKLTRKELNEWLDLVAGGGNCFVTLQVNDMGRSLFDLIDLNSDGRLSLREMRTAWERMKTLCKEDRGLAQADLPRSLRVLAYLGNNASFPPAVAAFRGQMITPPAAKTGSAPPWFLKMDLNRDGDVSPKEWLGTLEEFREIDADGDGLISAEEARRYEARKKAVPAKKPGPARPGK